MSLWPVDSFGKTCCKLRRNVEQVPFKPGHKYAGKISEYWTKAGSDNEPVYVVMADDYPGGFLEEPREGMIVCPYWNADKRITVTKAMLKELRDQFDEVGQPKSLSAPSGPEPDKVPGNWGNTDL